MFSLTSLIETVGKLNGTLSNTARIGSAWSSYKWQFPIKYTNSCASRPQCFANKCVRKLYEAILKLAPSATSHDLW